MNLYNLHAKPQSLLYFSEADKNVPQFFWDKYANEPEELKRREHTIATDAELTYKYARDVLEHPFPAGEEAISKDANFASYYAKRVLKADFYLDGKLIAKA